MQKDLIPVIDCPSCCMTGILGVSFAARIVSVHVFIVFASKATSHLTIFDIPMRLVREDQRHIYIYG